MPQNNNMGQNNPGQQGSQKGTHDQGMKQAPGQHDRNKEAEGQKSGDKSYQQQPKQH